MSKNSVLVSCINVKRSFLDGAKRIDVLKDVNLNVEKGEIIAIIGPSGSGKTTLLNIMACLDRPTSGQVYVDHVIVNKLNDDQLSKIRRHKIGMVFQEFYLLPSMSALENVEVPMIFDDVPENKRKERAAELLALVGLMDRTHNRPGELSGGEKQRVAIARAIANDPTIILADEPTGNLDRITSFKIVTLLKKIAEEHEKAVIMVTHDPDAALQTHRVLILRDGFVHQEIKKEAITESKETS
jgi:putative ABC transport system ATP-binding protein